MIRLLSRFSTTITALAAVLSVGLEARGQVDTGVPEELKGVDIVEHVNEPLPLDTRFTDDEGEPVTLRDYFKGERPVLLQLGYNKCPMLCNLVLNGTFDGLQGLEWMPGKEFEMVCISIDPTETSALASAKKESYLAEFDRPGARRGVHFLTGREAMSKAVADAVGFQFRRQENGDYSHAAVLILVTPDGRVNRYMYGTKFESSDLRLGLLEASEGRIGTPMQKFILWCHIYDANARGYVLQARRIMSIGGLLTMLVLGGGLAWFWSADLKKKKHKSQHTATAAHAAAAN